MSLEARQLYRINPRRRIASSAARSASSGGHLYISAIPAATSSTELQPSQCTSPSASRRRIEPSRSTMRTSVEPAWTSISSSRISWSVVRCARVFGYVPGATTTLKAVDSSRRHVPDKMGPHMRCRGHHYRAHRYPADRARTQDGSKANASFRTCRRMRDSFQPVAGTGRRPAGSLYPTLDQSPRAVTPTCPSVRECP
jgi:hypothetical protein